MRAAMVTKIRDWWMERRGWRHGGSISSLIAAKPAMAWGAAILFALLIVFTGIALFSSVIGAFYRVPQNFNEGWNAYFALAALDGPLYFPHEAPITNNYPPLSFYLIGGLSQFGGDPIYIGRIVSGAALIVVALNVYVILRLSDVDRFAASFCAVSFLGYIAIYCRDYVATNDPQWLGHAVMTAGLAGFIWGFPRRSVLVASAILMLSAGLVKQTLMPIPLAVTAWQLLYDRSRFRLWMITCLTGVAVAAAIILALHGPLAFESMLLTKRQYFPLQVANALYEFVAPTVPLLVLFFVSGALSNKHARLLFLYALCALVWDLYTMSAVGVAYNGILDYYIAVALLTGLSIGGLTGVSRIAAFAAVVMPLVVVASNIPKPHRVWQMFQRLEVAFRDDEALVRSTPDPVICFTSALCYWAGKPFLYDPFNEVRKMNLDPVYRGQFIKKIENKYYSMIQLKNLEYGLPIHRVEYFPDDVIDAINENYELFYVSKTGRKYYRPR